MPLYRSLLFWAGVVIMGFIGWGWWRSSQGMNSAFYRGWLLMNANSLASWGHFEELKKNGWGSFGTDPGEITWSPWRFGFPKLVRTEESGKGWDVPVTLSGTNGDPLDEIDSIYLAWSKKGDWQIFIPHWVLLLGFAVPWAGTLLWWRRSKAAANAEKSDGMRHKSGESGEWLG
ncbi:hypothetical protein [Haloferula sp. BvORR071]|uniref:hypothetical protein n=1 Tax=Haloferula sp. BvORR071 TaxID=1396141 RepID=UPI002240F0C8|nr:hypothetical protein [Haloferula sp. BvORR071]